MPPEWAPHLACYLVWPHNPDTWPGKFELIPPLYARMVAAINRVGVEGELEFWGNSFVSDPFGEVIARASGKDEETLVVECDLKKIEYTRRNWPFLRDRRIDAYGDLTRRFRS